MSTIIDTNLTISRTETKFWAESRVHAGTISVTVVGAGDTIKEALVDLANQVGDSLDPDTEDAQCPRCGGKMAGDECSEPGCDYPDPQLTPEQEAERRADW